MRHFHYKNLEELRQSCKDVGADRVAFEENPDVVRQVLARPVSLGSFRAGNSIAVHPMEGCDGTPDGAPGDLTWRRYGRFARGGAKLVWFEATAVREDGRANPRQLWITRKNADEFARILEHARHAHAESFGSADDLLMPMQLTHSGRFSCGRKTIACHYPPVDEATRVAPDAPVISDDELERLEDDYVAAARLAWNAGFRAFDIKATHGYLVSELLDAKTRSGIYGGPLENRTRFVCNILSKLRAEFGNKALLCVRLGAFTGAPYNQPAPLPYRHGFGVDESDPAREELTETNHAISLFIESGLQLLNISLGCPYYNPHIGRPFERPDDGNYESPEHPLLGVNRHFRIASQLQAAFPDLPMIGTGYSWLQAYSAAAGARNVADGRITFFGIGRGALAYPDFAREVLEYGTLDERRVCKTLTYCTYLMRQKDHPLGQWPTGCPPFDKEVYGPLIKEVRAVKRAVTA